MLKSVTAGISHWLHLGCEAGGECGDDHLAYIHFYIVMFRLCHKAHYDVCNLRFLEIFKNNRRSLISVTNIIAWKIKSIYSTSHRNNRSKHKFRKERVRKRD